MERTFEKWLSEVNAVIEKLCGLGYEDIADKPWWDWWEDGVSPREAAEEALAEEGFPVEGEE